MNNSKTLEPVEVYFKIQLKELPLNPVFVPQLGYLLSRTELENFVLDFVEQLLELKLSGKPVDSEQLFNQLVKPSPNEASR
jgi:hypothetical protein